MPERKRSAVRPVKLDQTQFDQYHLLLTHIARDIRALTKDNGKWQSIQNDTLRDGLAAIALACSTPEDNSEEVQALIDQTTKQINASSDTVEDAIKQSKGE